MEMVNFTKMSDGTAQEYQFLTALERDHAQQLPSRIIENLLALKGSLAGYRVDRLEHSLQTATRARRQGADKEL
ncbi:MAG: peptidase, partial [Alphaproteobacteria bacterium]